MVYDCYIDNLFAALRRHAPIQAHRVYNSHREVEFGLLTVGLKIHCLEYNNTFDYFMRNLLVECRGEDTSPNGFKKANAIDCWVLPPVGNAQTAIQLLEIIGHATEISLIDDPTFEIQVCSPGRLEPKEVAFLTIAKYLGSDKLRWYGPEDLKTTFSGTRKWFSGDVFTPKERWGKRMALYDDNGHLDTGFPWWSKSGKTLKIVNDLPFRIGRTDILHASTREDILNVNLVATLLVHHQFGGYWSNLGGQFRNDLSYILECHQLLGILEAPWITTGFAPEANDQAYFTALHELMGYVFDEVERIGEFGSSSGILQEVDNLLEYYLTEIKVHSQTALGRE